MKRTVRNRRIFLIAAVIWMAVIFFMSSRDGTKSSEDSGRVGRLIGRIFIEDFSSWDQKAQEEFAEKISFPVRKAAHMTEYAVLGFLIAGACDDRRKRRLLRAAGYSFLIAFAYAGTDEIHQIFVPGREGAFRDVLFDSAGAAIGIVIYIASHHRGGTPRGGQPGGWIRTADEMGVSAYCFAGKENQRTCFGQKGEPTHLLRAERREMTELNERLKQQIRFILEIDKEKTIYRQTSLTGHGRKENDAEHAWHMAIMTYLLREYANEEIDLAHTMMMCLIHDVVEIDAGDTYAYDEEGKKTQKAREEAAKERIYALLPEDQAKELAGIFDEFEANETPEAKFAHAMDNFQPLLLNDSNGGGDWREHGAAAEKVYARQQNTRKGSEKLYEVTDEILKENIRKGNLKTS